MKKQITALLFALITLPAWAEINIFATVPEWGALVREIGGDRVSVFTATTALPSAMITPGSSGRSRKSSSTSCPLTAGDSVHSWESNSPTVLSSVISPRPQSCSATPLG